MSIHLSQYFWLGFYALIGTLTVWSAVTLRKQRSWPTLVMLLGGTGSAIFSFALSAGSIAGQLLGWFSFQGSKTPVATKVLDAVGYVSALCSLAFIAGLLLFAQGLRRKADRVAELEAIVHDLQQRINATGSD